MADLRKAVELLNSILKSFESDNKSMDNEESLHNIIDCHAHLTA